MILATKQNKLWVWTTAFLSGLFAFLVYPIMALKYPFGEAVSYTTLGIVIIWVVFFIRVNIFNKIKSDKHK